MSAPDLPRWLLDAIDAAARGSNTDEPFELRRLRLIGEARRRMPELVEHVGMQARAAGHSWTDLARALGLSTASSAQAAIDPAARRRRDERTRDRDRIAEAVRPRDPAPGVGVTEAARRLGVTNRTVYNRVQRGELATVEHRGRLRIVGGDPRLALDGE